MNQADYPYVSGHGHHINGQVEGIGPEQVRDWWNWDIDCVVFSACSILDIGNYNDYMYPGDTTPSRASPGKLWEQVGPSVLLGYDAIAPRDGGGAPARILASWKLLRVSMGDVDAWMQANSLNRAWNACAIVKDVNYVYFKTKWMRHKVIKVTKASW